MYYVIMEDELRQNLNDFHVHFELHENFILLRVRTCAWQCMVIHIIVFVRSHILSKLLMRIETNDW